MPRLPRGQGKGESSHRSRVTSRKNARLQSSLSSVTVLVDQSCFSRYCGLSSGGGVDTSVATYHFSCAGAVPVCRSTLRGTTVGFRVRLRLVDTSAVRSGVNGTMRVQASFTALRKKPIFLRSDCCQRHRQCRSSDLVSAFTLLSSAVER